MDWFKNFFSKKSVAPKIKVKRKVDVGRAKIHVILTDNRVFDIKYDGRYNSNGLGEDVYISGRERFDYWQTSNAETQTVYVGEGQYVAFSLLKEIKVEFVPHIVEVE